MTDKAELLAMKMHYELRCPMTAAVCYDPQGKCVPGFCRRQLSVNKDKELLALCDNEIIAYHGGVGDKESYIVAIELKRRIEQPQSARLVSHAEDGSTCTLNIGGIEHYYDNIGQPIPAATIVGWLRGHEFIPLPEAMRAGDVPVFTNGRTEMTESKAEAKLVVLEAELTAERQRHDKLVEMLEQESKELSELKENARQYERILGPKSYQEVADELTESRAQVAQCADLLGRCADELQENVEQEGRLSSFAVLVRDIGDLRASLPDQSKEKRAATVKNSELTAK